MPVLHWNSNIAAMVCHCQRHTFISFILERKTEQEAIERKQILFKEPLPQHGNKGSWIIYHWMCILIGCSYNRLNSQDVMIVIDQVINGSCSLQSRCSSWCDDGCAIWVLDFKISSWNNTHKLQKYIPIILDSSTVP